MAHDERRLCVGVGLLVQFLHAWHLPSGFAHLQAVAHEYRHPATALDSRMRRENEAGPEPREFCQAQGGTVEQVQQAVVVHRVEPEYANETGDSQQVLAHGESDQRGAHP